MMHPDQILSGCTVREVVAGKTVPILLVEPLRFIPVRHDRKAGIDRVGVTK